jgi:hypothetical protein
VKEDNCNKKTFISTYLGVATGYGLKAVGSFPCRGRFFLFPTISKQSLRPILPQTKWVPGRISGVKAAEE